MEGNDLAATKCLLRLSIRAIISGGVSQEIALSLIGLILGHRPSPIDIAPFISNPR